MGVYLGYVRKTTAGYIFKPLAELKNSELIPMTALTLKLLLPNSREGIVWFYNSRAEAYDDFFADRELIIFEFETADLTSSGRYSKTRGYRADFMKFVDKKKIRAIQSENVYIVSATVDSIANGTVYELYDADAFVEKVFIPDKEAEDMARNDTAPQKKIDELTAALAAANEKLKQHEQVENLRGEIYYLQRKIVDLKAERDKFQHDRKEAEAQFNALFRETNKRMADIAFDSVMANKMLNAAANWDTQDLDAKDAALVEKISAVVPAEKTPAELKKYLCDKILAVRPNYTETDVLNIAICLAQNFLTVFYGEPGCGKTSICGIFAEVLGLNKIAADLDDARANRYVAVSVEKGWTSKRDFVGYYNPLSKSFDRSNRRVYDALRILAREGAASKFPFVILLDEANLSPMEYYWSDFMNLCDGLDRNSSVNLGEEFVYEIPETLRFVATINNDHTTEELSPRLIDRAWIISLPDFDAKKIPDAKKIAAGEVEIISWKSLSEAFAPTNFDAKNFPANAYDAVVDNLRRGNFSVSARTNRAILRYCTAAARFFGANAALDLAVAQKIMPKIHGDGDNFRAWLVTLQSACVSHKLDRCARIVQKIVERGDKNMGYYRFFA